MRTYSDELKASLVERMLLPEKASVPRLSRETGIPRDTLYGWRRQAWRERGLASAPLANTAERWRSEEKFAMVVETAARNEAQLGEYCRKRGVYPEEVKAWRLVCERANDGGAVQRSPRHAEAQGNKRRIRELGGGLRRKGKALAEAAAQVLALCHAPAYASLPPGQIVPRWADRGEYRASESSFYRILREADEHHHRGRSRPPRPAAEPPRLVARAPNEVWTWDISWLPGPVKGLFFYLYLIVDLYSRKIVGWEVYARESAEYAAEVVRRAVLAEGCVDQPPVLHADNGSPMKGETLLETLYRLGVATSYSRPRTSNDNPYSEALFRTCKYCPAYPTQGFAGLEEARAWMQQF